MAGFFCKKIYPQIKSGRAFYPQITQITQIKSKSRIG